jgi:hypothetical protein
MSMYGAEIALCDINKQQFATKFHNEKFEPWITTNRFQSHKLPLIMICHDISKKRLEVALNIEFSKANFKLALYWSIFPSDCVSCSCLI